MDDLLNGTLADALEKLAALAAFHRTGPEKVAAGDFLASLGSAVQNNPALGHALVGGGLGAAALGAHAAVTNAGRPEGQRRSVLGSAVTGGLAGAGAGAGVGLARQGLGRLGNAGGGIDTADALRPGQFTDPATGKRMMIDPKALRDNPDLHARIRQLTTPNLQSTIVGGVGKAVDAVREHMPTTAPLVAAAGAGDALLHNPLFGLARIRPSQASGQIGHELFQYGLKGNDDVSEALRRGANAVPSTGAPPTTGTDTHVRLHDRVSPAGFARRNYEALKGKLRLGRPNQQTLADILGRRGGAADGAREIASVSYTPQVKGKRTHTSGDVRTEVEEVGHGPRTAKAIRESDVGNAKMFGHGQHPELKERQLYRVLGRTYAGSPSMARAVGGRLGLYGTPLLAEYIARGLQDDARGRDELREIMRAHMREVPGGR